MIDEAHCTEQLDPTFPERDLHVCDERGLRVKRPGKWTGSRGEVSVGTKEKELSVLSVSRCPCGRQPNRDWRWSPWTRSAR